MTVILFILSIIQIILADVYVYNEGSKLLEDYDDQPASFGPSFPSGGLKGYAVLTNPKNACTQVAPPPNVPKSGFNWVAIISRTNSHEICDFDLKVLNAQNANFSAVIIYNYEDVLITMNTRGRNIKIPSTLITHSDGLSIISNYLYNETRNSTQQYHITIFTEQLFKFGAYLIPFVCVVAVSLLALICFFLFKCYLNRRRTRRHRLPRSALKQLKIKKFVKGDRWEVCAICLDDFEDGAKLRILPCDHAYHMKCIDPWLLNNRRQCPVCKRYVFPSDDNSDEDNNGQTATEQTPLIQPSNDNLISGIERNRQIEHRRINSSGADVSNYMYPVNESSTTDDDDDNNNRNTLLSTRPTTTNHLTTTDLIFEQPSSNSRLYSHSRLPRIILRQSSCEENDNTTTTTYGSLHESLSTSFTTPRAANFFVGSLGGTTDNTNLSARSVIEDVSDIETDDNDERMHSVLTDVEINQGYVPDSDTQDAFPINL